MRVIAEKPTLVPAVQAVAQYAERHQGDLSPEHAQVLLEIRRRLDRLGAQAAELIDINNRIWVKQGFKVDFDPSTDTVIVSIEGEEQRLKLKRADPNVPIQMKGLTAGSGYHAGTSQPSDEEEQRLRLELEEKLESYYQSAHRVLKLFGRVPSLAKIKCVAISRVRNELIEHPDDGALYSFGTGSTGPRVKPMHRGTPKFNDEGLVPNTRAFVDAIVAGCAAGAP
jgi:hypothetical protein